MALFNYKAYDSSGAKSEGLIEATSEQDAISKLKAQKLLPYSVNEEQKKSSLGLLFQSKVSLADLEFLTAELSLLLATGVRIDRGLDIIRRTKAKASLAQMLANISSSIKKGSSLSQALRAYPDVFDNLYCNLIELGEASGNLSEIFAGIAKDLKFKRELQRKIIGSLTYPCVILFVCILSIFFIFNFIIPKMADMFGQLSTLPWYTQLMLSISEWMGNYQVFLALAVMLSVPALIWASKQADFQRWWHKTALKLPVIANASITVERIRFNSGLSLMLKAGVPIDQALELAAGNIKNHVLNHEMNIARKKVKRGSQLTPTLQQTSLYPPFYISLLEVGEESGNLDIVFDEIANRSRQDFETWTDNMTSLIEPLMILFMGGFVGGIVVIMLMSMISLNDVGF
ncbi:MAG: secretion system protein [Pseudoalteromonadaceae bacterium]|jgi:general secretion pathway protein F|uniref:type II secretion system F family protein n=1 Tax=Pseudoalteromonas sp. bablab_jr004 TaxID=2755065 RepID=UPI000C5F0B0C|nr:type II secretion system F family protein [Pseudoalteromonas sp. bablab_jr004]MBD58453.1 secretion system protein [Pseudoalteromonas sp.]MBU77373.1 secretion system protein [Pseudoalteromonadaceae bacterium]|tara:strand:+ start:739 stop:1941 length:1203 start_codon:yes stop_codon:yes gene_type:complete